MSESKPAPTPLPSALHDSEMGDHANPAERAARTRVSANRSRERSGLRTEFTDQRNSVTADATPPHRRFVVNLCVEPGIVLCALWPTSDGLVELVLEVLGDLGNRFGSIHCPHRRRYVTVIDPDPYAISLIVIDDDLRSKRRRAIQIVQHCRHGLICERDLIRQECSVDDVRRYRTLCIEKATKPAKIRIGHLAGIIDGRIRVESYGMKPPLEARDTTSDLGTVLQACPLRIGRATCFRRVPLWTTRVSGIGA